MSHAHVPDCILKSDVVNIGATLFVLVQLP